VDMPRLLTILEHEGPVPTVELATRLGVSEQEVDSALRQARERGMLLRYSALVNWERVDDPHVFAIIDVEATPEHGAGFDRVADYIARFDEVHSVYLMSGRTDLTVVVQGKDFREIARFVAEKLAPAPGVKATATSFVLKTYKMEGELLTEKPKDSRLAVSP
jgi:DNA-binding Lrp family transcriptional regulator